MKKKLLFILLVIAFSVINVKALDENVVEINGKGYKSLSTAISKVSADTKTTIILLKDIEDNVTIKSGYDIVLDLQGYTLKNKKDATVITNNGTLEIKNGTVTSNAASGMINNNKNAILNISNGTLKATGSRQALYNDGGTTTISNTAYLESSTDVRATVHNKNNGTVNILGGTVIAKESYAIYNEKGILNIGTKNDSYNQTTPVIQGKTYGIIANSKINVYDGIIKGATNHLGTATTGNTPTTAIDTNESKIKESEEESEKVLSEEVIEGITYKTLTYYLDENRVKVTFNPNGGTVSKDYKWVIIGNSIGTLPTPNRVDHIFDGWFTEQDGGRQITVEEKPSVDTTYYAHWTYTDPNTVAYVENHGLMSLKDALAIGGKITLQKDVIITETLTMNKETTLDLKGYTISLDNKSTYITNKSIIKDSSENQTGKITSTADFTIYVGTSTESENAKLTVKSGTIEGLGAYGAIDNYGTVIIDGGTVQGTATTDLGYVIYDRNKLIVESGTVYSTNGRAIQVHTNATFTMDGGLVKSDAENDQIVNLYGDCSATINGGTIEGLNNNTAGIAMFHNTNLTVNGGTIKGHAMAIAGNGSNSNNNANIIINDGNMIATDGVGLYLPQQDSTTIINGGNISGPTAIEIRAGELVVTGGTITATNPTFEVKENASGTTTKGAAIAVSQHNTKKPINVEISGSTLKGAIPLAEVNPMNNPPEAIELITIEVRNGNFESTGDTSVDTADTIPIKKFITGGIYSSDPTTYVADGYKAIKIDDKYEVIKIYNITISADSIDNITIDSLKKAYKEEVTLEVKEKNGFKSIIEVTDTNGNKIEVKNNKFIMPESDVEIKVIYKAIINPDTSDKVDFYIIVSILSFLGIIILRKKVKA